MLRFAPSPTGDMSIASLRIAIINYLVSQQKNDQFLVRIEDINSKKNIEGKDTEVMMLLEKFALKHNAVFHQTEHLNLHQTLALRLLKDGKAFVCKCTEEELETEKKSAKENSLTYQYSGHCENLTTEEYDLLKVSGEKFVIRIKKPTKTITYNDLIQGNQRANPDEIDSFIILDSESKPTHNFACAADDMMGNVNFIIREDKHLINTPKQIHIKNLLGYEDETKYAHISSLKNNDESSSLTWLFKEGYIPDAILNYLLLLGNDKATKEIFTLPEAIEWFELESLGKSPASFDITKLQFINREHLKMMDDRELSTLFGFADADIGKLAKVYLKECSTINELEAKIRPIFKPKDFSGEFGESMQILSELIFQAPAFETFDKLKEHLSTKSGLKDDTLINPLRQLLTGTGSGPELSEIYPYIKSYILEVAS
ncbi:MAG: Glutamyl-tRNA(Gln) synthetase (EC [uncultured Sulfurovum sp.]|uniref:Glutamyl-tRNA(Gln) synthetase (EC) n=1 Tax=uncultured Sulfurovum sp. TaxID=269237 RepID=A0A6S6TLS9_9BACT|nr:MAG: Glutamyl-tRNA(Gln) synthetase (EC [uncultured Sulfurovum sp.]